MASFRLQSGDSEFNTRVDALFSSLQTVATELEPQLKRGHEEDNTEGGEEGEDSGKKRQFFSIPQGRPPQWRGRGGNRGLGDRRKLGPRNSTPDYIKNPQNWTRYNMRDTKVLSDRDNRREGLRLLADLGARREKDQAEGEQDMEVETEHKSSKIVFKKPFVPPLEQTQTPEPTEPDNKAVTPENSVFGGPKKFTMKEYVVGKTKQKPKGKAHSSQTKAGDAKEAVSKEVKLSYLLYEEED